MSDSPSAEAAGQPGDRSVAVSTEEQRRAKVERLRAAGVDPYPHSFPGRTHVEEIAAAHDPAALGEGEHDEFSYRVMGRITGKRGHGKTAFLDVRDITGTIQAYARRDVLGEEAFERVEDLDIGDLVGIEGPLHVTKRGQLAIGLRECVLLAKALKDPPDLVHGISDPDTRYRQRELDLMANEDSREVFKKRDDLLFAIRTHMHERGWVELETPVLQRLTGGAAARPFVTHHNALDRELFLRTATELYLKRAIVGGFEDVYEFGKFFRNEGMSPQHNPEFTMLEMFVGAADYNGVMEFIEVLVSTVVEKVMGTTKVERAGVEIECAAPWPRVRLRDELLREIGLEPDLAQQLVAQPHPRPRRREVDLDAVALHHRRPHHLLDHARDQHLDELHDAVVVGGAHEHLQHRELGVVLRRHPLVAEELAELVDVLEAADDRPLQVQLGRGAQEQLAVERVVVGDERSRRV